MTTEGIDVAFVQLHKEYSSLLRASLSQYKTCIRMSVLGVPDINLEPASDLRDAARRKTTHKSR